MKRIVQKDESILREHSENVSVQDIASPKIQTILKEMKEALASQSDGIAIAAPQIGYLLRIFIVSENMFCGPDKIPNTRTPNHFIYINPVITKISKSKKWLEEGCLSVRYLYGYVERSEKVSITAYDENGKKFEIGASGLLAQIFQHEVDHLNGILFIDKARDLQDMPPEHVHHHVSSKK